jgi:hypothetical protein
VTEFFEFQTEFLCADTSGLQELEDPTLMIAVQTLVGILQTYRLESLYGMIIGEVEEYATKVESDVPDHRRPPAISSR